MAETLGEAVLELRTDDSAFTAGVSKAEAAATGLGKTLDMASGSAVELAGKLDQAASSGHRGAQAYLAAGNAIDALAAAQVQAKVEIDNAKASLNAGTIGLEEYNREVLQTKAALAIFEDEHRKAQLQLRQTIATMGQATAASGAQRAGITQLTQNLGDMSTMYALGMQPQQIFATQVGQVAQAIQLTAGEGSKFARFLGGPWGIGIMVAVQVLGPFIGQLLATEEAMKKVELASDGLADAQGVLGKMFDLTTGKLKNQNDMLRLNAELMAINLRAQAAGEKSNALKTFGAFGDRRNGVEGFGSSGLSMGQKALGALGVDVSGSLAREGAVRDLVADIRAKRIDGADAARRASALDFTGLSMTKEEFIGAIRDGVSYPGKEKIADAIEKSLKDKELDPSLRQPGTGRTKKESRSATGKTEAEVEAAFQRDMEAINRDELQAQMQLATSAEERADIGYQMLGEQRAQREAEIKANKDYSEAQKQKLIKALDGLYGEKSADGTILVSSRPGLLEAQIGRQQREEEARLANDMLARQAQTLEAWAQVSTSSTERARLEAEALKLQQQIQTNLLEQQIATGQVADAEQARTELRSQQEAAQTGLAQRNAGPLAAYVAGLRSQQEDTGQRIEQLMVNELDWVHQSIANSISERLGVKDPFLKGLIDMFVQDVLIRPFAEALQNAQKGSSGGGGIFGSLFKVVGSVLGGGASPQASLASSASATISDPAYAGLFASGGTIPDGGWGIVGEAGPEAVFATDGGVGVLPNSALRSMGGGTQGPQKLEVSVSGARGNAEIQEMVNAGVSSALSAYDAVVGDRVKEHLERRG